MSVQYFVFGFVLFVSFSRLNNRLEDLVSILMGKTAGEDSARNSKFTC